MAEEREDRDLHPNPTPGRPAPNPWAPGAGPAPGPMGGPVGAALGGVAGAVVGGLGGKAAAESIDPSAEEDYWRASYTDESYYQPGLSFDDYSPAYRLGWTSRLMYGGEWGAVEPRLA